jgi:hypothetical protein
MLARDNVLVGDDPAGVTFEREGVYTDQTTGKPVAATTRYTYEGGFRCPATSGSSSLIGASMNDAVAINRDGSRRLLTQSG